MSVVPTIPDMSATPDSGGQVNEPPARSQWQLFRRRFFRHKAALLAGFVLIGLFAVCFGADYIAPYEKNTQDLLIGPVAPNGDHWFGTDQLGRDTLTELLYAGQISLKIGLTVALLSTAVGTILGAIAGFYGKLVEQLLMRLTDLFLVVPAIAILAIALKRFGQSDKIIIFVLAGLGWMYVARVVRGLVLSVKEKEFVEAARAAGASSARIIFRHILPNCVSPVIVVTTIDVAYAMLDLAALSFLGLGVQPPTADWGTMLSEGQLVLLTAPHLAVAAGSAIVLAVLGFNLLGDGLRDVLDPRQAQR